MAGCSAASAASLVLLVGVLLHRPSAVDRVFEHAERRLRTQLRKRHRQHQSSDSGSAGAAPPPPPPLSSSRTWWRQRPPPSSQPHERPNFLLVFFDDAGYGDLGANNGEGQPSHTPFIDSLARSGVNLQSFYVAASICTPSRAALLTGRHGQRTGVTGHVSPKSRHGLPKNEVTMAAMLKAQGYSTIMLGKWHLGHSPGHLPTDHGFQEWLGVPFSNDMGCTDAPLGFMKADSPSTHACPTPPRIPTALMADLGSRGPGGGAGAHRVTSFVLGGDGGSGRHGGSGGGVNSYKSSDSGRVSDQDRWIKMGKGTATVLPLYHTCKGGRSAGGGALHPHRPGGHNRTAASEWVDPAAAAVAAAVAANAAANPTASALSTCESAVMRDIVTSRKLCFPPARGADEMATAGTAGTAGSSGRAAGTLEGLTRSSAASPSTGTSGRVRVDIPRGGGIVEQPVDLWSVADRFAARAESFIAEEAEAERPFFMYLALTHTHVPHTPASCFRKEAEAEIRKRGWGHWGGGGGGDGAAFSLEYAAALREADYMTQRAVGALEKHGVGGSTLTFVTSDNGPWLAQGQHGGSPGPFRGGKFSLQEGGIRVFAVAHWPGRILTNGTVVHEPASTMDLLPTFMALAGTPPSHDALKTLDGVDISQSHLLLGPRLTTSTTGTTGTTGIEATTQITSESGTSRDSEAPPPGTAHAHVDDRPLFFQSVPGGQLGVMRLGRYKMVGAALFDVEADKGESHDLAKATDHVFEVTVGGQRQSLDARAFRRIAEQMLRAKKSAVAGGGGGGGGGPRGRGASSKSQEGSKNENGPPPCASIAWNSRVCECAPRV